MPFSISSIVFLMELIGVLQHSELSSYGSDTPSVVFFNILQFTVR